MVADVDIQPGEHTAKVDVQPAKNRILDVEAGFY
jgi:hypothetical protein